MRNQQKSIKLTKYLSDSLDLLLFNRNMNPKNNILTILSRKFLKNKMFIAWKKNQKRYYLKRIAKAFKVSTVKKQQMIVYLKIIQIKYKFMKFKILLIKFHPRISLL